MARTLANRAGRREDVAVLDPAFRPDLYQGTAQAYDEFRLPYPADLVADLAARTGADGTGNLLDLACGTGQAAFALAASFAEIWAVDQEPEMIDVARHKADAAGAAAKFRLLVCDAAELSAPAGHFDLITVGNAFHRLPRTVVARASLGWLRPGGFLALLWGGTPTYDDAPWQRALAAVMQRWQHRPGVEARVPAGYAADRDARSELGRISKSWPKRASSWLVGTPSPLATTGRQTIWPGSPPRHRSCRRRRWARTQPNSTLTCAAS